MSKVNCLNCEYWQTILGCKHQFRWASNAGGRGIDCKEDVWFCRDYDQKESEYEESSEYE